MGGTQSFSINYEELQKFSCIPVLYFTQRFEDFPEDLIFNMDMGIDESLLRYSGIDSTTKLEEYSSELLTELGSKLPGYVEKVGSTLAGFTAVPNAVGTGALGISMILHFCFFAIKQSPSKEPNPEDLLQHVFAEKSSEVCDLMDEYMKRYRTHVRQDNALLVETKRLEEQLSSQLTRLNSMLMDGHMDERAFKHWTNGAGFHAQMLIHIARLKKKKGGSDFENAKITSRSVIDTYNRDLYDLIEKYKTYKAFKLISVKNVLYPQWNKLCCELKRCCEMKECELHYTLFIHPPDVFINFIFSNNTQIEELKTYFSDLQKNHDFFLTAQIGRFQISSITVVD